MYEIEARVRNSANLRESWALDISTIHSFCLNAILRPNQHLLEYFEDGFSIIGQDSDAYEELVGEARNAFGKAKSSKDSDLFAQLRLAPNGNPMGAPIVNGQIGYEEAKVFWQKMYSRRLLDFSSLLYFSLKLCLEHRQICDYISARYQWILVDEFQDTTDVQVEIFKEIYSRGHTHFFLVGDLHQSIFGFAGAAPSLAEEFANTIGARRDLKLSANFRSSPAIVADAERMFSRVPPMRPEGPNKTLALQTEVVVAANPISAVTQSFLPRVEQLEIAYGNCAILANSWFKLIPIAKELRRLGVPVLGPGARPYRRQRVFAVVAERICGHLCEPDFEALVGVERSLFEMVQELTNRAPHMLFTYKGRRLVYQILEDAESARQNEFGGMDFLYALAARVSERLLEADMVRAAEAQLLHDSVVEMERDIAKTGNPATLSIEDLGMLARPKRAVKLLTFHASKGREFEAVAMVDLNEGSIPFYSLRTEEEFAESKRLFYVGLTRAEKYLLYAPDNNDHRNRPSRYLGREFLGK